MEGPADAFHLGKKLDNRPSLLMGTVANSGRAPTSQSHAVYAALQQELASAQAKFAALAAGPQ